MSVVHLLRKKFAIEWRQQDCIEKIKQANQNHHSNGRIIAFEDPKFKPGCRKFIATGIREFYLWYKQCPPHLRHFYELIMESTPCRLYFDLEFMYEFNDGLDGVALVQKFCQITCKSLHELLGIQLDSDRHFLILDSTSNKKFSAHVIVHIPNDVEAPSIANERIFPDNICLKQIVTFICSKLLQENCCLVNTGNENKREKEFLCDLSVYSKNRNFRLYQSSKCGKKEALQLADYCNFYKSRLKEPPKNAQIFLDSLVIPYNYATLPIFDNIQNIFLETSKKLLNGQKAANIVDPIRPILQERQNFLANRTLQANCSSNCSILNYSQITQELAGGLPPSPFPRLDNHMLNQIFKKFNEAAEIRVWRLICYEVERKEFQQKENKGMKNYHMQYQLTNSRFCLNRRREHRSQNVYWVVDLSALNIVQRCFDKIDCPNFVSPPFALPKDMCEYLHGAIDGAFRSLGIPENDFVLPDPENFMNHYCAEADSFNRSAEWMQKYGNIDFLQLQTPPPGSATKKRRVEEEGSNNTSISPDESVIILN